MEFKNHMAEVAKILGKKIGEEFRIRGVKAKLCEDGLYVEYNSSYSNGWILNDRLLVDLLIGKAVIIDEA
jgi:hypothetical protein